MGSPITPTVVLEASAELRGPLTSPVVSAGHDLVAKVATALQAIPDMSQRSYHTIEVFGTLAEDYGVDKWLVAIGGQHGG